MTDIDFLSTATEFEPTRSYAGLREHCPVHRVEAHEPPFYVVSRFDDVVDMLRRNDLWLNGKGPGVFYQEVGTLGSADDPDHARHRAALRRSFVPTNIARLEPMLRAFADELLDEFVPHGAGDFVHEFALPFPAMAIGALLGVRAEDRDMFHDLTLVAVAALTGGDIPAYNDVRVQLGDYMEARLHEREAMSADELPDDVLTALLHGYRGGSLSMHEVRHLGHQLLIAGHETTTSLIGMMLYRLLERPELMQRLRDDSSLIPVAIEEALRFDSPVNGLFRTNAEACPIAGVEIAEGTKTQVLFASANRDPERFQQPDEFDIDRPKSELGRHVAFGWGVHFCIGAPLARLETRIAFERILARMGDIELAGEAVRNESFVLHGLTSLPLKWVPR